MKMDKDEAFNLGSALIEASASKGTVQVIPLGNTMVVIQALNGYTVNGGIIVEDGSTVDEYEWDDIVVSLSA